MADQDPSTEARCLSCDAPFTSTRWVSKSGKSGMWSECPDCRWRHTLMFYRTRLEKHVGCGAWVELDDGALYCETHITDGVIVSSRIWSRLKRETSTSGA